VKPTLCCLLGSLAATRTYRARGVLPDDLARWLVTPSFVITASRVFAVLVYAQIVGQKELWHTIMATWYLRPVKDVVEELHELLASLLMELSSLTCLRAVRGRRQPCGRSPG